MDKKSKNDSPFGIESLEEDSGFLMLQVSRLWADFHERKLKKHFKLSELQYAILASIYWLATHSDKQVTQTLLAKHTKIKPMTISQMFKVLENKGYIHRTTHATDIRAKAVHLTPMGLELMSQSIPMVSKLDDIFFKVLGKDLARFNKYMVELLNAND